MANVVNRNTMEVRTSVNIADFQDPPWKAIRWKNTDGSIGVVDISDLDGVPRRYWKWDVPGDRPVEMNAAEKAAADTAILEGQKDNTMAVFDGTDIDSIRGLLLAILDEFNVTRQAINDTRTEINTRHAQSNLPMLSDRTIAQMKAAIRAKL